MKKIVLTVLTLALLSGLALAEGTGLQLPSQIASALSSDGIGTDQVTGYLPRVGDGPYFSFVAARNPQGRNVLYGFSEDAAGWRQFLKTDQALSQAADIFLIDRTNSQYDGMQLGIAFSAAEDRGSSSETVWEWNQRSGQFRLRAFVSHDSTFDVILETIRVQSDGLSYEGWRTEGRRVNYKGTVQTELRYFPYSAFPKTPQQMESKLTTAPAIPAGEMTAQNIRFTGNRTYEVFSGPGGEYMRGGNGKASVSTNDWIQVFGSENGWILIQYAINKGHMRFGYIPEGALPAGTAVGPASFAYTPAWLTRPAGLTDDPLFSGTVLLDLQEGLGVRWLSTMGQWAYVETYTGDLARGFVPLDALTTEERVDLSLWGNPGIEGELILHGAGGRALCRVRCTEGMPGADEVIAFVLFDGVSGAFLTFADGMDEDAYYETFFDLPADCTSVLIVGQLQDGSYAPNFQVRVDW